MNITLEATGSPEEIDQKQDAALQELAGFLEQLKNNPPDPNSWIDSPEMEAAVKEWAERHSYTIMPLLRTSLDIYH